MKSNKYMSIMAPLLLVGALMGGTAQAVPVLFEYGVNIDGTVSMPVSPNQVPDPVPAGVDVTGFDDMTGLGLITVSITGAGAHTFDAFFDHEIDEPLNTFYNEYGVGGTAAAGQSWEIDEPGYLFGDIFDNFLDSTLDNTNAVPAGSEDDVSMAMGWDFTLGASETALIELALSTVQPIDGFFLIHTDPDSNESIYLSSSLTITGGGDVPAPGVLSLLCIGLAGMGGAARLRKTQA